MGLHRLLVALLGALALGSALAAPAISAAPRVELGTGGSKSYLWSVNATAGAAMPGPCLLVAATWRSGPLEYQRSTYRECASVPSLRRSGPPLIAVGAQPSTGLPAKISAVGMIFPPAARSVRVTLAGGRTDTIRLSKLDPTQANAARLRPFRYAAFAIHGEWCAERLVSLDAHGIELWDSGIDEYVCGSEGGPHFSERPQD